MKGPYFYDVTQKKYVKEDRSASGDNPVMCVFVKRHKKQAEKRRNCDVTKAFNPPPPYITVTFCHNFGNLPPLLHLNAVKVGFVVCKGVFVAYIFYCTNQCSFI